MSSNNRNMCGAARCGSGGKNHRFKPGRRVTMTKDFTLDVNGKQHKVNVDPDMPLLYALRDDLGLNNPHFGCGLAQCGAFTVHLDGEPVRSCVLPVSAAANKTVTTIAGLGTPDKP